MQFLKSVLPFQQDLTGDCTGASHFFKPRDLAFFHSNVSQVLKQLRLRAKTGQNDIDVKIRQARDFLSRRDKVKINVMFKGRENAHHERGMEMLQEVVKKLEDIATVEQAPRMESGKMMSVMLTPIKH